MLLHTQAVAIIIMAEHQEQLNCGPRMKVKRQSHFIFNIFILEIHCINKLHLNYNKFYNTLYYYRHTTY